MYTAHPVHYPKQRLRESPCGKREWLAAAFDLHLGLTRGLIKPLLSFTFISPAFVCKVKRLILSALITVRLVNVFWA